LVRVERADASGGDICGQKMGAGVRITAVLTVRNEGAFLLEWFAHHRACGFSDFLVFSNDCTDGTDAMLDRLQALGWLTHVRNDGPHREGPQWSALKQADTHPLVRGADWILYFDIDEFVNIHVGQRQVCDLLAALPEANAITLTWRFFGNAGVVEYTDRPITETFTRAAPSVLNWPWRAALFKTLFRNDGTYRKLGVHRPRSPDHDRLADQRWFDGSGRRLAPAFHVHRIFSDFARDNYRLVQLNHYALGAMESFVVKCDRGSVFPGVTALNMDYWVERNFCQDEDRSIQRLDSADLRQALQADPVLGPLHRAAVAWRHARFAALMTQESWRSLFGRLLMTPPTKALSPREAKLVWQHSPPLVPPKVE
jgi:Glycosyl transferase family 2